MLKVWRGKKTLFAECTDCGSYGTAGQLQTKIKMTPEIEAAVERHTAHMMALRSSYQKSSGEIARQIKDGSIARGDGTKKIRGIWENHVAQIHLAAAALPSPEGQVTELVLACPWCDKKEQVEVEALSDDADEPPFEQAKAVVAYIEAEQAKQQKGK